MPDATPPAPLRVERVGDTVRRPPGPGALRVHELLLALERVGFPYPPRFLGIDDQGREVLSWIEGESGPQGWAKIVPEDGLRRYARLLRELHGVTTELVLPSDGWARTPTGHEDSWRLCHGDFGPWNVVWCGAEPAGIIDWDFAGPAPAVDDVAYTLEYVTPFRDDETAVGQLRYPTPPDRMVRAEVFCDEYGIVIHDIPSAVADRQEQDMQLVLALAELGVEPQSTWVREGVEDELGRRIAWTRGPGAKCFNT